MFKNIFMKYNSTEIVNTQYKFMILLYLLQESKTKQLEYKFYLDNDRFATVSFFNDQIQNRYLAIPKV